MSYFPIYILECLASKISFAKEDGIRKDQILPTIFHPTCIIKFLEYSIQSFLLGENPKDQVNNIKRESGRIKSKGYTLTSYKTI